MSTVERTNTTESASLGREITSLLSKNKIPSRINRGHRCGDDRDGENKTVHAIFGATLGYVYTTLAAAHETHGVDMYDPQEVAMNVFRHFIDSKDGINTHTDDHDHNDANALFEPGCGFNNLAWKYPGNFNLNERDLNGVYNALNKLPPSQHTSISYGKEEHKARAVLIVTKGEDGINSKNFFQSSREDKSNVFVLHLPSIVRTLSSLSTDLRLLKSLKLVKESVNNINDVDDYERKKIVRFEEQLKKQWFEQTEFVAGQLASNLPIYSVEFGWMFKSDSVTETNFKEMRNNLFSN